MCSCILFSLDFDFKSLGDKDNKWVSDYHTIKGGLSSPLYFLLPMLDTKYLGLCKRRQRIHAVLTELLDNINDIIEEKRKLVKEKKNNDIVDHEKDLLTLMIESEAMGAGQGLSNEELKVISKKGLVAMLIVIIIEQSLYFLPCWP